MPKRVAVNRIIVNRNGSNVEVKPGDTFDFTADEVEELEAIDAVTTKALVDVTEVTTPAKALTKAEQAAAAKAAADDAAAAKADL